MMETENRDYWMRVFTAHAMQALIARVNDERDPEGIAARAVDIAQRTLEQLESRRASWNTAE